MPRCSRRRGCRAKCSSSCSRSGRSRSAACPSGCTGSCGESRRNSASAPISRSAAGRRSSIARCWKSSSDRSSTCCATRWTTASSRATSALRAGKTETGEITLTVRQVGNEIAIELADDGSGIDLESVRRKAVAQGRIAADAQPTDAQLIEFIFQPGLLDGLEGHADLGARRRDGRRALGDRHPRRPRRGRHARAARARPSCSTCR